MIYYSILKCSLLVHCKLFENSVTDVQILLSFGIITLNK